MPFASILPTARRSLPVTDSKQRYSSQVSDVTFDHLTKEIGRTDHWVKTVMPMLSTCASPPAASRQQQKAAAGHGWAGGQCSRQRAMQRLWQTADDPM